MHKSEAATFLNVDLEIESNARLNVLVTYLQKKKLFLLHHGAVAKHGRGDFAAFELSSQAEGPEAAIQGFFKVLMKLPPKVQKLWRGARRRTFNVGIQAGAFPDNYENSISPKSLAGAAALGAAIGFTIYGARPITPPAPKRKR